MADLGLVPRIMVAKRTLPRQLVIAALCIAVPALVRWAIDRGHSGFPFATFMPALVLASVLLDWPLAVAVAVLAAVVSTTAFVSSWSHAPMQDRFAIVLLYFLAATMIVTIGHVLRGALSRMNVLLGQQTLLAHEMRHRFKNSLSVINSLTMQTFKSSAPEQFPAVLSGRLNALAKAADLVSLDREACDLRQLIEESVAPFQTGSRISLYGPEIELTGRVCTALILAMHELATNAIKYGALSGETGGIRITWTGGGGGREVAAIHWREHGGPRVEPPERTGFGTRLMNTLPSLMEVERDFKSDGLCCTIRVLS